MTTPRVRPTRAWVWGDLSRLLLNFQTSWFLPCDLGCDKTENKCESASASFAQARGGSRRWVFASRTRSHERREPPVLSDRLRAVGAKAGRPRRLGGRSGDAARAVQGHHRAPPVRPDAVVPSSRVLPHGLAPRRGHHQRPRARGAWSRDDETSERSRNATRRGGTGGTVSNPRTARTDTRTHASSFPFH